MLVLREALAPVMLGAVAGLSCAILCARLVRTLLFGVVPTDPVSLMGAPLLLCSVALLASYVPARRALRVDPMIALRED
jgi:putative ABC transport system permease protein